jgi:hypothetical protein
VSDDEVSKGKLFEDVLFKGLLFKDILFKDIKQPWMSDFTKLFKALILWPAMALST